MARSPRRRVATQSDQELDVTLHGSTDDLVHHRHARDPRRRAPRRGTPDQSQHSPRGDRVRVCGQKGSSTGSSDFRSIDHQRSFEVYNWLEEGGSRPAKPTHPARTTRTANGGTMTYYPVPFFLDAKSYGTWSTSPVRAHRVPTWRGARTRCSRSRSTSRTSPTRDRGRSRFSTFTATTGRPDDSTGLEPRSRRRIDKETLIAGVPAKRCAIRARDHRRRRLAALSTQR